MRGHITSLLMVVTILALAPLALALNIPLPKGQFEGTTTGSFAICVNSSFQEVNCSTTGALVFPQTFLSVGNATIDSNGNSCGPSVQTTSDFPVDISPPLVTTNANTVSKLTDYDRSTGAGDVSFTGYTGGTCHGATFDSTGATQVSTGTEHFVVSVQGKRIDAIITQLTGPIGGIGDFAITGVAHQQ